MNFSLRIVWVLVTGILLISISACRSGRYNSDYNLNQALIKENKKLSGTALASADTTKPELSVALPFDKVSDREKSKKKKPDKRYFMGVRVKRGFIKSGRGKRETVETYSYLPEYQQPNPYAPEKWLLDIKKKDIVKLRTAEPEKHRLLHGPYVKRINDEIIEEGYFYMGTKHLRWEKYNQNGILLDKEHFDKGFPREATVTFYGDTKKIKEVIPYEYGILQGTYYRFYENGEVEWIGQYEKGRKVGVWIQHYDFRHRRHYEYQYPETAYDPPFEPFLIKEYDRHGTAIYERGKFDKRSAQR
jgi:antitoxin component YwqK of YwqJK toxin-antitoxin module